MPARGGLALSGYAALDEQGGLRLGCGRDRPPSAGTGGGHLS